MSARLPLFRRRLFSVLSGPEELVVVRGNRFAGKTTLLRTWAVTDPCPESVFVFGPPEPRATTPDGFWSGVLEALCVQIGQAPRASNDGFEELGTVLASVPKPVVLVLDDIHRVHGAEEAVGRLLQLRSSLRIVVSTRVSGNWDRQIAAHPDRMLVDDAVLAFTVAEVSALCRTSGVPQDERTVERITCRTSGAPGLVSAVCDALRTRAACGAIDELIESAVDDAVKRAVDEELLTARSLRSLTSVGTGAPAPAAGPLPGVDDAAGPDTAERDVAELVDALAASGNMSTIPLPKCTVESLLVMAKQRLRGRFDEAVRISDTLGRETGIVPGTEERVRATSHDHPLTSLHRGITYLLGDRLSEATMLLCCAQTRGADSFVERDAAGKLALVEAVRGHMKDAQHWIREELRHRPLTGEGETIVRTAGRVAAALVAMDRLDLSAAASILDDLGMPRRTEEFWGFVLFARGRLALLRGTPADGLRFIEAMSQRFPQPEGGIVTPLLDAIRADLHLATGNATDARRILAGSTHPATAPVRARLSLITGNPEAARDVVHREDGAPDPWPGTCAELALIAACAHAKSGRRAQARRFLQRAVMLSRNTGSLRMFATLPRSMLRDLETLDVELPVDVDRLGPGFGTFREIRPSVRLTPRERVVLDALLAGGNAATIARDQFVSPNTIKSQLRSLYRKLGVSSRAEALAVAHRIVSHVAPASDQPRTVPTIPAK